MLIVWHRHGPREEERVRGPRARRGVGRADGVDGRVARAPSREVPLADESTAAKDLERDYLLFPCRMISEKARVI